MTREETLISLTRGGQGGSSLSEDPPELKEASPSHSSLHGLTDQLKANSVVVLRVISQGDTCPTLRYVVRCGGRCGSWHLRKETGLCDFDPASHLVTVIQNGRLGFRSAVADGKLLRCNREFYLTFASWQLGSLEAWSLRGYSLSDCVLWHNKYKLALNVSITVLAEPSDSLGNLRITFSVRGNTEVEPSIHSPASAVSTVTEWSQMRQEGSIMRSFSLKSDVVVSKDHVMETATEICVSADNSPSGKGRKLQRWSWSRKREFDNGESITGTSRHRSEQLSESISGFGVEEPAQNNYSPGQVRSKYHSTFMEELVREVESSPSRMGKQKLDEGQLLAVALKKVKDSALSKEKEKLLRSKLQAAVLVLKSLTKQKLELIAQNAKLEAGNKTLRQERERDFQLLLSELSRLRTELRVIHNKSDKGEQQRLAAEIPTTSSAAEMPTTSSASLQMPYTLPDISDSQGSSRAQELQHKPVLSTFSLWTYLPIPILTLAYVASLYRNRRRNVSM